MGVDFPTLNSKPLTLVFRIPINGFSRFFDELKNGRIVTTKCRRCGKLYFPPVSECGSCFSSEMDWVKVDSEGEVEAFTHVVVRPESFKQRPPYTLIVGRLKDGIKVFARLLDVNIADVKIGMKVRLRARITDEGEVTYEFIPV